MRLNLYWRGMDVVDIEVHAGRINAAVWQRRPDDEPTAGPGDEGPRLQRGTAGQHAELSSQTPAPDTTVFGFGTP